jgi:hypothetical protein
MYMVTTYLQTKKKIIKVPSKLKKSRPTINFGVPIIEYIDLLDEPKEKKKGHHCSLTNYSFDPFFSLPFLLPFPKVNLKFDHTIKTQKSLEPTLATTSSM